VRHKKDVMMRLVAEKATLLTQLGLSAALFAGFGTSGSPPLRSRSRCA